MHRKLQQFIDSHREYFDGDPEALFLRPDLRRLFDQYAQAMDPEEYSELKRRVEEFRESEKKRLQEEIEKLVRQRQEEEQVLEGIMGELNKFHKELQRIDRELSQLTEPESVPLPSRRSWYQSGYLFLLLDFLGVFLLYIGIILNEKLTMSYVILGMASIILGFILQGGAPSMTNTTSQAVDSLKEDLSRRKTEVEHFSRIKKMSLMNRKTIALGRIRDLNREIEVNRAKMNEHLRE